MRVNLTKKDLVNLVYMQIGFSKQIAENLIDEFFSIIIKNLDKEKKVKISKFGTFFIRKKSKNFKIWYFLYKKEKFSYRKESKN